MLFVIILACMKKQNQKSTIKNVGFLLVLFFIVTLTAGCGGEIETDPGNDKWATSPEGQAELLRREQNLKKEEAFRAQQKKIEEARKWNDQDVIGKVISKGWELNARLAEKITGTKADSFFVDEVVPPKGEVIEIFKIGNDLAVQNEGQNATVILENDYFVTELWTYHWNDGAGFSAGAMEMIHENGTVYGPWMAELYNGVYWVTKPNQILPAGNYTVVDSDPFTWSQNSGTNGQGMTWMNGIFIDK